MFCSTFNETACYKNVNNCLITNFYSYLETSGGQVLTPVLIRHLWQLKTVVFLHWFLIRALPFFVYKNRISMVWVFVFYNSSSVGVILLFSFISSKQMHQMAFRGPIWYNLFAVSYNRRAHIRQQCRKTTVINFNRCLINTGVEKMN